MRSTVEQRDITLPGRISTQCDVLNGGIERLNGQDRQCHGKGRELTRQTGNWHRVIVT